MRSEATGWEPGARVSRYRLVDKLATGGMAEIWLAQQTSGEAGSKLCVIKRILELYSRDPDFVSMFLDEARIAAQLNHPNIVQIYDLGLEGQTLYIAMEYLPGETLSVAMRGASKTGKLMPPLVAARIVCDAAAGLGHAHTKRSIDGRPLNIVHRDVSPQNLMITHEGNTKVVDFGVARAADRATHTLEGQVKGKLAYMAPEQAAGRQVDSRCDVFSLGIILFEAATSTRFYESRDATQLITYLCGSAPLPRAIERNSRVPKGLSDIIDVALSRDPAQRYRDGNELHAALSGWLQKRADRSGTTAVAAWLRDAFGDGFGRRAELVDPGLITAPGLGRTLDNEPDTLATTPAFNVNLATQVPSRPRRRLGPVIAAGALLISAGVGVGLWASRSRLKPAAAQPSEATPKTGTRSR